MAKMSTGAIVAITGGVVAIAGVGLYFALRPKKKTPTAGRVTPTAPKPVQQQPVQRPVAQQPQQQSGGVNLNVADTISAIGSLFKKKPATSPIKVNEQGLSQADLFYDEFFKTYGYGTADGGGVFVDEGGSFWEEYFNDYYANQGSASADFVDYSMFSI